jgi:membrane-associated protein
MEAIKTLIDLFLHVDDHLLALTHQFGIWTYVILFAIIFMETGLVVTPFLPGDSLLFAAGSLASLGAFNIFALLALCITAAFLGDTVNYWIGHFFGERLYKMNNRFLKREHMDKASKFYEKHGPIAIVLARFVPIVRTFAPCVAGMSKMHYSTFMMYNLLGGILWVAIFTLAGFFFGNIPFVQHNFHYVMVAIVLVSVVPIMYEWWKAKQEKKHQ